jgi:hypothetical protein
MKTRQGVLMAAAVVVAAAVGGLAGWSAGVAKRSRAGEDDSPVVARVGDRKISAAELKARMAEFGPMAQTRLSVTEGKRELLDGMIRTELLAQAARARGMEDDFSVRRRLDEALAEALLQKDLEPRRATVDVTDAELRTRFEQDKAEFSRPERVRIAHLFISAPEEPAAQRARRKAEAEALLADAREALRRTSTASHHWPARSPKTPSRAPMEASWHRSPARSSRNGSAPSWRRQSSPRRRPTSCWTA